MTFVKRNSLNREISLSIKEDIVAIDPLSKILQEQVAGYDLSKGRSEKGRKRVNHLVNMDDLKIYAETDQKLSQLIEEAYKFSRDINMEFCIDKCSKCTSGKE